MSDAEKKIVSQSVKPGMDQFVGGSEFSVSALPPAIELPLFDDLNTPSAFRYIGQIFEIQNNVHNYDIHESKMAVAVFRKAFGLLQKDPDEWFKGGLDYDALVAEYDSVRAQALAAKEAGDKAKMGEMFKRSDEIRDQFKAEGVVIESGAGGKSAWRKA